MGAMMAGDPNEPTVVVIDDDVGIRDALQSLLRSVGFQVELFPSVQKYLATVTLTIQAALFSTSAYRAAADSTFLTI